MKPWEQLSADQVHALYKIPQIISYADDNVFYSNGRMPGGPYDDGPWPLIAFLRNSGDQRHVTVQVCTVHFEFLNGPGDSNPLSETFSGYLTVNKKELIHFNQLLRGLSLAWPSTGKMDDKCFTIIEESEFDYYHLRPKNHPKSDRLQYKQKSFFERGDERMCIITISCGPVFGPYVKLGEHLRFTFEFRQFYKSKLEDPSFTPLDHDLSKIDLDRQGLQELAAIFEYTIEYYENKYGTV